MSALSDTSEEVSDTKSQKDEDFRINNYDKESDSDDSWYDVSETNNDENVRLNKYSYFLFIIINKKYFKCHLGR